MSESQSVAPNEDFPGAEPTLLLLSIPEVFVYKLPQAKGSLISRGRRAEEWDLGNPLVTGSVKVVSVGMKVYVQIFKSENELFAAAPIEVTAERTLEFFLESCTDTSRYFVLRIEDPKSKRHAYIGIGFRQRQSAFDLRAALVDQIRRNQRLTTMATQPSGDEETDGPKEGPPQPNVDLSLKEGETIKVKINIPSGGKRSSKPKKVSAAPASLRPPAQSHTQDTAAAQPLAQAEAQMKAISLSQKLSDGQAVDAGKDQVDDDEDDDDDDWGDFQS